MPTVVNPFFQELQLVEPHYGIWDKRFAEMAKCVFPRNLKYNKANENFTFINGNTQMFLDACTIDKALSDIKKNIISFLCACKIFDPDGNVCGTGESVPDEIDESKKKKKRAASKALKFMKTTSCIDSTFGNEHTLQVSVFVYAMQVYKFTTSSQAMNIIENYIKFDKYGIKLQIPPTKSKIKPIIGKVPESKPIKLDRIFKSFNPLQIFQSETSFPISKKLIYSLRESITAKKLSKKQIYEEKKSNEEEDDEEDLEEDEEDTIKESEESEEGSEYSDNNDDTINDDDGVNFCDQEEGCDIDE